MRSLPLLACALAAPLAAGAAFAACSSDSPPPPAAQPEASSGDDAEDDSAAGDDADSGPAPTICQTMRLPARPFAPGPYGTHRGDTADDFTLPLVDGTSFGFKNSFTGCESYVFVPDTIPVSALDSTSVWNKDLDALIKLSPQNAHYFFVSEAGSDSAAATVTKAMQSRVDASIAKLKSPDADVWRAHLHVVSKRAAALSNWVGQLLSQEARSGFAIDRRQRIRALGMLADVNRFDPNLQAANQWPWQSNLAYAAHEAIYQNAQSDQQDRLDAENATVVPFWQGDVLAERAEIDVALPSAQQIAAFDTLEVEVTQQCPSATSSEFSSCGAWDYLASLWLFEPSAGDAGAADAAADAGGDAGPSGTWLEMARFITSYHRETHWVEDISPMIARILAGGTRHFKWSFAPPWNTQPTATRLSLRFSNQKKGYAPESVTWLFGGGAFNDQYNTGRAPVPVPIPQDAKRVEVWSLLTGHGSDANQCCEFCDHGHVITVASTQFTKDFPMAGTDTGCIAEEKNGMVPNQGGTWWFGRGGWCPGKQVDPWVIDATSVAAPGTTATISYKGQFGGGDPPAGGGGNIDLAAYLAVYH